MALRRSGIRGVSKLRRTLGRIDPQITTFVRHNLAEAAQAIKLDAIRLVPVDQGELRRSIDYRISRDGMSAIVGPAAQAVARVKGGTTMATAAFSSRRRARLSKNNKKLLMQFFKGYWIEFGTKGAPQKNIPPLRARPFMRPAWDMNERWLKERLSLSLRKAIDRAAQ